MMNFKDFKTYVAANVKNYLTVDYDNAVIEFQTVRKNNGVEREALLIKTGQVAPTIYLDTFYNEYLRGKDINDIVRDVAICHMKNMRNLPDVHNTDIADYSAMSHNVRPRVVNAKYNEAGLESRPHRLIADDLAVVYVLEVLFFESGTEGSIAITDEICRMWNGVDEEMLYEQATSNLRVADPYVFEPLDKVLAEIMGGVYDAENAPAPFMYMLSAKSKLNGAAYLTDVTLLNDIRSQIGDFYIIPSSIHEVLIVPLSMAGGTIDDLNSMVNEVNFTEVDVIEQLSDHIYLYDDNGISVPESVAAVVA